MEFEPTGTIHIVNSLTGETRAIPVMEDDGALYTQAEWESCTQADWELDEDGELTFQGDYVGGEYEEEVAE